MLHPGLVCPVLYTIFHNVFFFPKTNVTGLLSEEYVFFKDIRGSLQRLCINIFCLLMKVKIKIATWCSSKSKSNIISKVLTMLCTMFHFFK